MAEVRHRPYCNFLMFPMLLHQWVADLDVLGYLYAQLQILQFSCFTIVKC